MVPVKEESKREANKLNIFSVSSPNESPSCLQTFNEYRPESKPSSMPGIPGTSADNLLLEEYKDLSSK